MTSGVYAAIRNPSRLGLLVSSPGCDLAFRSGARVLLTVLMIPPFVARMGAGEALLRAQFGAEYEAYCAHTSRLIPKVY